MIWAGSLRVTHPFATKPFRSKLPISFVRLACIRHAASVHPEPGSNSPFDMTQNVTNVMIFVFLVRFISFEIDVSCLVFKDRNVFRFLRLVQRSYIIPNILPPVNAFFIFFSFFYRNCYNITEKDTNKAFSKPLLVSFI